MDHRATMQNDCFRNAAFPGACTDILVFVRRVGNSSSYTDFKAFSCVCNWSASPQGDVPQPFCLDKGEALL